MSTDFNYVVNVDTSRVMGAMQEVRSQMGGAMTPGAPMGMPSGGGGFGTMVGGGAHGMAAMMNAMVRFPTGGRLGYGTTFTDPAMAYSPHYGMPLAHTTPGMERLIDRQGLAAAGRLRPPGVSAGDFFMEVTGNRVEREAEARRQAFTATRTTMVAGGLGLLGGIAAAKVGERVGPAIAGRLGLGDFGRKAGGILGGIGFFMAAESLISGAVQEHYADVERIGGTTRELGEIVGAGRGLTRESRYKMGRAVRQAANDLNMDVQAMGDVMAGARQAGMLPSTTDPNDLRNKAKALASSIDEAASMLGSSMSSAMQVIKGMTGMGFGAREGVSKLIGMAGAAGVSPMAMFGAGMQGAGIARRAEIPGRMGFDIFTQGILTAARAGGSRQDLGYVGGVTGLGKQIGMMQMGHMVSPMGDLQLMAMSTGQALPADLAATAKMAMQAISKGGDPIGNILQFNATKQRLREGLGARGAQMMTRQAIMGEANIWASLSSNLSQEEAFMNVAMGPKFGMSSKSAELFFAGTFGGGGRGGGRGGGGAALAEAQYNAMVGSTMARYSGSGGMGLQSIGGRMWDRAVDLAGDPGVQGAGIGLAVGGFPGAIVGYGAGKAYEFISGGGLDISLNAADQADREFIRSAQQQDRREASIRERHGLLPFDAESYSRVRRGKVDIETLQLDASSIDRFGVASNYIVGQLAMAGIQPVEAGPGTIRLGDNFYRTSDVRSGGRLDAIMSNKGVSGRAVKGASDWIRRAQTTQGSEHRRLRKLATEIKEGTGDTGDKLAEFATLANLFLGGAGDAPEGALEDGRMTATGRRILEKTLGIDISGLYGGLSEVRGSNIVGLTISSKDKQVREDIRGELNVSIFGADARRDMSAAELNEETTLISGKLWKSKKFKRLAIKAAKGEDVVEDIAALASGMGVADPGGFAERFAGEGAKHLRMLGEQLGDQGSAEHILGISGGGGGRGGGKKGSSRGSDQFQGAFNPIGFGETESALSLINTSLQKTAGMIDTLDARVRHLKKKPK